MFLEAFVGTTSHRADKKYYSTSGSVGVVVVCKNVFSRFYLGALNNQDTPQFGLDCSSSRYCCFAH